MKKCECHDQLRKKYNRSCGCYMNVSIMEPPESLLGWMKNVLLWVTSEHANDSRHNVRTSLWNNTHRRESRFPAFLVIGNWGCQGI